MRAEAKRSARQQQPGVAVDAHGGAVIDPTKNVLDLVDAAVQRLDDLADLRAQLVDEKIKRLEREQGLIAEMADLRADHQKDLDALESKRLDAMRQVDQLAVKTEADRASSAITALAQQAATTAETLRSAVNTSATNLATQLDRTVTAITERIAALEKSSYTGAGKQAVADPQIERLSTMVEALARSRATDSGKREGISLSWAVLIGVVALIGSLLAISSRATVQPAAPAPQNLYAPAPAGTLLPSVPSAGPR